MPTIEVNGAERQISTRAYTLLNALNNETYRDICNNQFPTHRLPRGYWFCTRTAGRTVAVWAEGNQPPLPPAPKEEKPAKNNTKKPQPNTDTAVQARIRAALLSILNNDHNGPKETYTDTLEEVTEVAFGRAHEMVFRQFYFAYCATNGEKQIQMGNSPFRCDSVKEHIGLDWKTKKGKITKRLSKHFHDKCYFDIPKDVLAEAGNVLDKGHITSRSLYMDTASEFDWKDGKYGKSGSCWFNDGAYNYSRTALWIMNGLAWRWYDGEKDKRGIARAWIAFPGLRDRIDHDDHKTYDGIALFNLYGMEARDLNLLASWLTKKTGLALEVSKLQNFHGDDMYINGEFGYLIHTPDAPALNTLTLHHSPGYPDRYSEYASPRTTCTGCGDRIDEDDALWSPDGAAYCESCFDDRFFYCHTCVEVFEEDEAITVDGHDYCYNCARQIAAPCCQCNEWESFDDGMSDVDGEFYCERCGSNILTQCDECGELFDFGNYDKVETEDGHTLCSSCAEDHTTACAGECGGVWYHDDCLNEAGDGELYCDDCLAEKDLAQEEEESESEEEPVGAG